MATAAKRKKLVTPPFRGSYVHLDKAYSGSEDVEPCFSILIVLDPEDKEHAEFIERLEDTVDDLVEGKWGEKRRECNSPLKEGEDIGDGDELQGKICLNVRSKTRPGIVDADAQKILDVEEECYSGAIYRVSISAYVWEHKVGGKGVSFGLDNVMKVDDGDHLGGGRGKAEDDFAEVTPKKRSRKSRVEEEEEEDEPAPRRRRK